MVDTVRKILALDQGSAREEVYAKTQYLVLDSQSHTIYRCFMLRFSAEQVVFQEVPGEVSLAFTITGCPVGCKGCHSADSWPADRGELLTPDYLSQRLKHYHPLLSCVLMLGGEWQPAALIELLKVARDAGLNTCLYTGYEDVSEAIKQHLTYLKTGPWIAELGGLTSPTTNQKFYDLRTQTLLNHRFLSGDLIACTDIIGDS